MATIEQVFEESKQLAHSINKLFKLSGFNEYDDLSGLEMDRMDPDDLFLCDELQGIMSLLQTVTSRIEYLERPIKSCSTLRKNERGRYETEDGYEYTCGDPIEALIKDDRCDIPHWIISGIEHNDKDYFIVGYSEIPLEGLTVRVRSR